MTSTCAHDGVRPGDSKHDNWCLVSTTSQDKGIRKRISDIFDREDVKCNGFSVKWDAGSHASGHALPMVGIFSSFSLVQIPKDPFVVIQVKVVCAKSRLDVRHKEVGHIILLRSNEKMDQYFEWYDNNYLYSY